jgi:tRNA1Val (adenine37-N6)-methyltransferase
MANSYFQFKQFTIQQDRCAMKVGTDGVLLGAWADISGAESILDIGTGTGLIALMLAQRSRALIAAIDIDKDTILQAKENIDNSPWHDRISVQHISLQELALAKDRCYDLIVSNPPYFQNSLKCPDKKRNIARHGESLGQKDLVENSAKLLTVAGRLAVIIPAANGEEFIRIAGQSGLFCLRKTNVFPREEISVKRLLLEFGRKEKECIESNLIIESGERHCYSDEFKWLTRDFYLDK